MARLRYSLVKAALDSDHTAVAALTSESFDLAAPLKENGVTNIPTIGGGDTLTVRIGQTYELAHITAYTSGALTGTWTRGAEGSTPTAHSSGDIVRHVITDADLTASGTAAGTTFDDTGLLVLTPAADVQEALELADAALAGFAAGSGNVSSYVWDGDTYEVVATRIFTGPNDPDAEGFTLDDGDQWVDPS